VSTAPSSVSCVRVPCKFGANEPVSRFVGFAGKVDAMAQSALNMGYLVSPYHYPNGSSGPIPVSMVSTK